MSEMHYRSSRYATIRNELRVVTLYKKRYHGNPYTRSSVKVRTRAPYSPPFSQRTNKPSPAMGYCGHGATKLSTCSVFARILVTYKTRHFRSLGVYESRPARGTLHGGAGAETGRFGGGAAGGNAARELTGVLAPWGHGGLNHCP